MSMIEEDLVPEVRQGFETLSKNQDLIMEKLNTLRT